ncbi:MAG TPA: hypothetical protein VKE69_08750, partial [Planctomycetota bacterium]|nr:hypothetical protein [Planctomycetota bacterium]
ASRPSDERASRPSDERASRPASAPAIDLATEIVLARAHAYTTQDRGDQALAALRPLLAGRGVAVEPWLAKAAAYAYATRGQYGDLQRATAYLVQSADQLPPAKAVAAKLLGGMFFFFHQSTPAPKAPGT